MARIRSIKPTFFLDSDIASLSPMARIFFIGLWCLADREGRLKDKPRELGVQLIPYDLPNADPEALLKELAPRFILRYEVEGRGYLYIRGFEKHQRPANSEPDSDIPEPPADILATNLFVASSTCDEKKGQERKGKEGKGKEGKGGALAHPPTIEQVRDYCRERGNSVNPSKWMAHYESNGWRVGRNPMKDWKAAVRTWEHGSFGFPPAADKPKPRSIRAEDISYESCPSGLEDK